MNITYYIKIVTLFLAFQSLDADQAEPQNLGDQAFENQRYEWALHYYDKERNDSLNPVLNFKLAQTFYHLNDLDSTKHFAALAFQQIPQSTDVEPYVLSNQILEFLKEIKAYELAWSLSDNSDLIDSNYRQHLIEDQNADLASTYEIARLKSLITFLIILFLTAIGCIIYGVVFLQNKKGKFVRKIRQGNQEILRLEQLNASLDEENTTKDRLFSVIGHDLRGPMGSLKGILELTQTKELKGKELMDFIPNLIADVERVQFTLNNLLNWGQAQMNKTQVRQGTVTLRNVVDSNIQLLQKSASDKSIKVIQNINEKVKLLADKHHVDIIIRNLLSNAIKFTPENGLITLEVFDAKDGFWELHIKDTGIGLEASVIDSILNTNRVHSTYGTQNEKGTGIGLSLCLDMVTRNGGEMTVASEPGKGSTFMVKLPAKLGRTLSKPISNQTVN